jgi:hypothetical protein
MKIDGLNKSVVALAVAAARAAARDEGLKIGPAVSNAAKTANGSLSLPAEPVKLETPVASSGGALPTTSYVGVLPMPSEPTKLEVPVVSSGNELPITGDGGMMPEPVLAMPTTSLDLKV